MIKFLRFVLYPILANKFVLKIFTKKSLFIFTFHEVSSKPSDEAIKLGLHTPISNFSIQITFIKKYFSLISPVELESACISDKATAMITFDDAYESWFSELIPWLVKEKTPALFFTNGGVLNGEKLVIFQTSGNNYLELRPRDIQVKSTDFYQDLPLIEGIYWGNHLWNHFNALHLTSDELRDQYILNESFLKKSKNYLPYFAYPFGQPQISYSQRTHRELLALGAEKIFTAYNGSNEDVKRPILKRFSIPSDAKTEKEIMFAINYGILRAKILGIK